MVCFFSLKFFYIFITVVVEKQKVFTLANLFVFLCVFLADMTGTKQSLKSSSQSWQKMYPRMVCVSTTWRERYKHT